jgi:hypothetical protein
MDLYQGLMVKYETTGTPPTINAGGDASNGGSTTSLVNGRTYFIESSFQVGSSINYVTTIKEFPTSAANINFTSAGSGTHTFTVIGIATDKDIIHIRNNGYAIGDMLRYTYPSGARFAVNNPVTEEKDYYFVERLLGSHNIQVNFTIGELTPKLQEFIGLTASSSVVAVSFTASGFTAPLTWSVTSGTLPAGLSLNTSTGAITGTPNAAYAQATVRITVSDAASSSDFADVTFQINPPPNLYNFTSATFTPGGASGSQGPNINQARSGVGQPAWTGTYLNMSTNGYMLWTVPQTADYNITMAGAQGGNGSGGQGGFGNVFTVRRSFTQGQVYTLIIGQAGQSGSISGQTGGGGGGGTFFYQGSTCLMAAGGGGGNGSRSGRGLDGQPYNVPNGSQGSPSGGGYPGGAGGSNGSGGSGSGSNGGSGGAGINGNGNENASYQGEGGRTFSQGFVGGGSRNFSGSFSGDPRGGFGGGAGVGFHSNFEVNTGGGGGYSGGGGSGHFNAGSGQNSGGGGGSFIGASTFVSSPGSVNSGNGYITITRL